MQSMMYGPLSYFHKHDAVAFVGNAEFALSGENINGEIMPARLYRQIDPFYTIVRRACMPFTLW